MKPNCSKHKKEVFGVSEMKEVATAIGDLDYSALVEFVKELRVKLSEDAKRDSIGGRPDLAKSLFDAEFHLFYVVEAIAKAWKASKRHMNQENENI